MEVYLVDGTFELFRSYYGAPGAKFKGQEVGAVRGLLRSLYRLVENKETAYIACAFDHVIESFRNDLFDGYKTGDGIDPDLFSQFQIAEDATAAMGIKVWSMTDFEADDGIATGAHFLASQKGVDRVIICSPDKDFAQCLVHRNVVLWDRIRDNWIDYEGAVEKFGVPPESMADYLALVGDTADGIPGVPKWGAKSSSALLREFGQVENIPDDPDDWSIKVRGAKGLATSLGSMREEVSLYKTLATLRLDAPIDCQLSDIEWNGVDEKSLEKFCQSIGDDRFFRRLFG